MRTLSPKDTYPIVTNPDDIRDLSKKERKAMKLPIKKAHQWED